MASLLATGLLLANAFRTVLAQDVDPIIIKGTKFYHKNSGDQFFIKGIAYQQDFTSDTAGTNGDDFVDPLKDSDSCARDIPYLRQLDTNTIRVYALDAETDHSACMSMLADAGIYVLADLGSPSTSINSDDPAWNLELYDRYTQVIDNMAKYDNTLGFFAGNEIITQPNQTFAAPFAKAAVRDMKKYIKDKNYRPMGVGYATNDNPYIRENLANYMNCGDDQDDAIDFWGYNVYSWCGDSSFEASGYDTRVKEFSSYNVPVFFAEYGCNTSPPRLFTETPVLLGPMMDEVFSGGIVYLYFQEVNDFGLVDISDDGKTVSTLSDFNALKSQITGVSPSSTNIAQYTPSNSPQACPTSETNFSAVASPLPPRPDASLCECMFSSLGCIPDDSVDESSYGDLFDYICGMDNGKLCTGIDAFGNNGTFGAFGMCNPKQQLGYVLNQYYSSRGGDATACAFSGSAVTQAAATTGSCAGPLSSANANGGKGDGSTSPTTGGAAMGVRSGPLAAAGGFGSGTVWAAVFFHLAVISGVGMIML